MMRFRDRADAGRRLAEALAPVLAPPCVVAGIPRGGVAVALPVIERFGLPLTVVYARKLTAAVAPEFAFGAIDEDGHAILHHHSVAMLGLWPGDVEAAKARVGKEIRRRMETYGVPALGHYLPGSAVVLVDDGLATGLTMQAALEYARRHGAREIVVAVPCASTGAAREFERLADRFVSLLVDPDFVAVGQYYADFSPVSDDQVIAMLARARTPGAPPREPVSRGDLRVVFKNSRGLTLAGRLLLPLTPGSHATVVFAHGCGSGKDSPRNRAVAEALRRLGFAAFLFDFTGHGESEGAPEDSTQEQQVDDLAAALDTLEGLEEVDRGRLGVGTEDPRPGAAVTQSRGRRGGSGPLARTDPARGGRARRAYQGGDHPAPRALRGAPRARGRPGRRSPVRRSGRPGARDGSDGGLVQRSPRACRRGGSRLTVCPSEGGFVNAHDLMTPNPVVVTPQATVGEAWDLMRELDIRHLPVVQDGALVGMVSDRDLARVDVFRLLEQEGAEAVRRELGTPVAHVMTGDVIAVGPETEISDVVALLIEHRIGAIPVVASDSTRVEGIVSYIDVLRAVRDLLGEEE